MALNTYVRVAGYVIYVGAEKMMGEVTVGNNNVWKYCYSGSIDCDHIANSLNISTRGTLNFNYPQLRKDRTNYYTNNLGEIKKKLTISSLFLQVILNSSIQWYKKKERITTQITWANKA